MSNEETSTDPKAQHLEHMKSAYNVAVFISAITALCTVAAILFPSFGQKLNMDAWSIIDVTIYAILAYNMKLEKRGAYIGFTVFYILSVAITISSMKSGFSLLVAFVFTYYLGRGTLAAIKHHKIVNTEDPSSDPSNRPMLLRVLFGFFLSTVFFIVFLGGIAYLGPSMSVYNSKSLPDKYYDFLRKNSLIEKKEELHFFYSSGFIDFRDSFYFFTDKKVTLFQMSWGGSESHEFKQISDIQKTPAASALDDPQVELTLTSGEKLSFPVTSENQGFDRFHKKLVEVWKKNK